MSTQVRVAAFVAGVAVIFAAAFGIGALTDPDTAPAAEHGATGHGTTGKDDEQGSGEHAAHAAAGDLHLMLAQRAFAPGDAVPVSFQVQDPSGEPVRSYDVEHEKELHLIVLGTRSLTDFQHVHPTRASDGTWTARLRLAPGTSYRLYADASTAGEGFLATADLFTTGSHPGPDPVPGPTTTDRVAGFDVELDEAEGEATLQVTRDGAPVELEPYLGALGHLVVIRADDLAYLHVHPEDDAAAVFSVSGLAPGRYRYFFDFQVDGVVHTAAFTHDVSTPAPDHAEDEPMDGPMDGDEAGHDDH
jgi:hypothetical protein